MKKTVIAYPHFHWDREWYKEYEKFRFRLFYCFDIVLDMLKSGDIPSFYFDGQTSALSDYLEINPDKVDLIKSLIQQEKLFIGPFYCLVDEFLTSKSAFRKNIELGLKFSKDLGCNKFIAYFADTFGHSSSTIPILKEFGIDKAIVWRGCGDIPSEFEWCCKNYKINTVNLIRGYFNDIFSTELSIEKKVEFLTSNLDKISEKSGDILLMPIGADHLALPKNLKSQIDEVNKRLNDYEIVLGSPFDYFDKVRDMFSKFQHSGELRDNSKTFILEGSYSSRLDIKKLNIQATHQLDMVSRLVNWNVNLTDSEKSTLKNLIEYAYKLLIQNQAHDSICGCSTNDVHQENVIRYKKILQITDSIISDFRFKNSKNELKILNLDNNNFSGSLSFNSSKDFPFQVISKNKGFPADILNDINKIPVTEDYTDIYEYKILCKNQEKGISNINFQDEQSDVFLTDNSIGNSNIFFIIKDNKAYISNHELKLVDFNDLGDSYNYGVDKYDNGTYAELISSKALISNNISSTLELKYHLKGEIITALVSLNNYSDRLDIEFKWKNTRKNHLLQFVIDTNSPITKTLSEDLDEIIERNFDFNYDARVNLPSSKGVEVFMNNAPMQRGVFANGISIVTEGITQYEVYNTELRLPLLRATGLISNPNNPSRTTPAGPPIEVEDLQQLGFNNQKIWISIDKDLKEFISEIYNFCLVI